MSELAERAKLLRGEIGSQLSTLVGAIIRRNVAEQDQLEAAVVSLIEQALLAERRLALEEAAEIADSVIAEAGQQSDDDYWSPGGGRANVSGASEVVTRLRAAAEKEVQR